MNSIDPRSLRELIDVFSGVTWPVPQQELTPLATGLGWTVRSQTEHSMRFETAYPTNSPRGSVTVDAGNIGHVSIPVTDRFRDADSAESRALADAAPGLRDEVSAVLGPPRGRERDKTRASRGTFPTAAGWRWPS